MKISTKGRYALRIMLDLAENCEGNCIPLKDISERQGITIKYMEQIMPLLTRTGFVKSFRGNNGGYRLTSAPENYTIGEILRATEGSLSPIACVEDTPNQCKRFEVCKTVAFWEGLRDVINEYVDGMTLADLLNK
jgi:Rrf2 family protein